MQVVDELAGDAETLQVGLPFPLSASRSRTLTRQRTDRRQVGGVEADARGMGGVGVDQQHAVVHRARATSSCQGMSGGKNTAAPPPVA